jgi:DNA-binding transcriptional ArsR family regulator
MDEARVDATPEQIRALASPVRLRILRLCATGERTNQELARRLERDPATILHHVRLLVATGLLEPATPRPGRRGAFEKPYRVTGLSWRLRFHAASRAEQQVGTRAAWTAFLDEVQEAGGPEVTSWSRFFLHLDEEGLAALSGRLQAVLDEYAATDAARRSAGLPAHGGMLVLHRLAPGPDEGGPGVPSAPG